MVILGFGRQEEQERHKIKQALHDGTGSGASAEEILGRWNQAADTYDKMPRADAPERYTSVHYYDGTLHFFHVNRNHPFPPMAGRHGKLMSHLGLRWGSLSREPVPAPAKEPDHT